MRRWARRGRTTTWWARSSACSWRRAATSSASTPRSGASPPCPSRSAATYFDLEARLGFLLKAFQGTIEAEVGKQLDEALAKESAKAAKPAGKSAKPAAKKK